MSRLDGKIDPARIAAGSVGVLTSDGYRATWQPAGGAVLGRKQVIITWPAITHGASPVAATSITENSSTGDPAITVASNVTYDASGDGSYYIEALTVFIGPGVNVTSSTVAAVGISLPWSVQYGQVVCVGTAGQQARMPGAMMPITGPATSALSAFDARVLTSTGTGTYDVSAYLDITRFAPPT